MIDPATIHGRRLAMIAWGTSHDGRDDVAVLAGIAHWNGATLTMRRDPDSTSFVVPTDWLSRLQPVREDLKQMLLGAEYSLSVTVGNLEDGEDASAFESTGLRWPGSN